MKESSLTIFIDGLPYYLANLYNLSQRLNLVDCGAIEPAIGYSVNVKSELYSGLTPDKAGFFGEWNIKNNLPEAVPKASNHLSRIVRSAYILDGILHKFISKMYFNVGNIPWHLIRYFSKLNAKSLSHPSIFTKFSEITHISVENSKKPLGFKDREIFRKGLDNINSRHLFISFGELDLYGHLFGIDSEIYVRKLETTLKFTENLICQFRKHRSDAALVVLSDHGMVSVKKRISNMKLEETFGRAGKHSFVYFLDSTIMRVWTFDKSLYSEISSYLEDSPVGKLLKPDERKRFGITSAYFGDLVFLLNEGSIFRPTFYSTSFLTKAMHGYHPELQSQKAICLISEDMALEQTRITRSLDIYHLLYHIYC